jgi:hypothetical protein
MIHRDLYCLKIYIDRGSHTHCDDLIRAKIINRDRLFIFRPRSRYTLVAVQRLSCKLLRRDTFGFTVRPTAIIYSRYDRKKFFNSPSSLIARSLAHIAIAVFTMLAIAGCSSMSLILFSLVHGRYSPVFSSIIPVHDTIQ